MKKKKVQDAYAQAGVNIDAGNEAVRRMKAHVRRARTQHMLADIGSFGGLFQLPAGYKQPVLVGSTDGVGTKLLIAGAMKRYDSVGQDLVNHCVNDILVQGAEPLFFMDYFATGKLKPAMAEQVVKGLSIACRENGCALLGGETAEMPGLYHGEDFDLAGTIVGIVDKKNIMDGSAIRPGDVILGLPSSGLQTNGYSLARRVFFEQLKLKPQSMVPELKSRAGDALLAVHRSFLPALKPWLKHPALKGMAHITGGGFIDNIPRILPEHCRAEIRLNTWPVLPVFQYLEAKGKINQATMFRTFNMGIGFVLVVAARQAQDIMRGLRARKEPVYRIGVIARGPRGVALV